MTVEDKQELLNKVIKILPIRYYNDVGITGIDILSDPNAIRLDIDSVRFRIAPCGLVEEVQGGILASTQRAGTIQNCIKKGLTERDWEW